LASSSTLLTLFCGFHLDLQAALWLFDLGVVDGGRLLLLSHLGRGRRYLLLVAVYVNKDYHFSSLMEF
jgi:hypothetical protein